MKHNPYRLLGIGLIIAGATFAPVSYFVINSVPITAIALSYIAVVHFDWLYQYCPGHSATADFSGNRPNDV